jgi:hypothetical protein
MTYTQYLVSSPLRPARSPFLRHRCEHLNFLVFFLRFWLGPGYPVDVGPSFTARVGEVSSLKGVDDAEKYCS